MNTRMMMMMLALAVSTGCVTADSKNLTKSEAQQLIERGEADDDICTEAGFNDDGVCDAWCPDGDDADCPVSTSNTCEDDDTKTADDGCNTCFCEAGTWACTEIACNTNNTNNTKSPPTLEIGDCSTDGDPIDVTAVTVSGDRLDVEAGFGGGCAAHTVTACWDGSFMESDPVQARITLIHDANGEAR